MAELLTTMTGARLLKKSYHGLNGDILVWHPELKVLSNYRQWVFESMKLR